MTMAVFSGCHQISDFKAKRHHQILFPLRLRPRPSWGAYNTPLDLLTVFNGPTSNGKDGKKDRGMGKEGRGRKGTRREKQRREREGGK